jgi:hypothetical protein
MLEILKLNLQGFSAYKIARKLGFDPPTVYASLKAAKQNFREADKMLTELKALGWPMKLPEVEEQIRNRNPHKKKAVTESEIAIKMG